MPEVNILYDGVSVNSLETVSSSGHTLIFLSCKPNGNSV